MQTLKDIWSWPSKPVAYRGLLLTDLPRYVEGFLLQLGPGSVFLLERETKAGFLHLAISERRDRWLKVEYGLPDDEWSRRQFDEVHTTMVDAGFDTTVETDDNNKQIPRFLRVYAEGNRDELTLTLVQLLETAAHKLEFEVQDRYTLRMLGQLDPDYAHELAAQIEQRPRSGWLSRTVAKYLRRFDKSSR